MKKTNVLLICSIAISDFSSAAGNWSAEKIIGVTSYSDNRAAIQIKNYSNPNPSSAAWNCTGGVMYIGDLNSPAPNGMLSVALSAFATQKPVRFYVSGSGADCYTTYITIIDE